MHTIDLAYVGRGMHEELVAYIADQQDYYADEGVHVALRHGATIGLGRTLLSRLNAGIPWVALTVNTHRPLFWFLARLATTAWTCAGCTTAGSTLPWSAAPWHRRRSPPSRAGRC